MSSLALLTNSRLKDSRACQRLHKYKYVMGYRSVLDVAALAFGTAIHLGLEAWWKGWALVGQARIDAALAALPADMDVFDRVRAEVMLHGYHYRWEAEPYAVLGVELQFECPLRNPATGAVSRTWRLAGKLDVMVRDLRTGLVHIVEHKTSSEDIRPGSSYFQRLRLDGQVSAYYEGATSLGYEVAGCIYDVLGKPALRPLKATPLDARKYTKTKKDEPSRLYAGQREVDESPEEYRARIVEDIAADPTAYYQRADVVRLEEEVVEALQDTWQLGRQIRESELVGFAPRNPDACQRWGRTCEFFACCTGMASLDDTTLFEKVETVHPELTLAEVGDAAGK